MNDLPVRGRVLVVDDEPLALRAVERVIRGAGYDVDAVTDAEAAVKAFAAEEFDTVITDIRMPGMDGIELLQELRRHDSDMPVILITGMPAVSSAIAAIDNGAYKYLVKPVTNDELEAAVTRAVQHSKLAQLRRRAARVATVETNPELRVQLERAMGSFWMAYQPIVNRDGVLFGHEALLRSEEASLRHPVAVIAAAEKLQRVHELGRVVRRRAAEPIALSPDQGMLFVNLHPNDLEDEELLDERAPLSAIASRVVLEITERASIASIDDLRGKVTALRGLGYQIAVDDLGAGYAGLTSFALLEPDFVKIDMSLVRDVDQHAVKQRLILSITSLCRDMGIVVVAEGVENLRERDTLLSLGCDLVQGYFIAKPGRPFPDHDW